MIQLNESAIAAIKSDRQLFLKIQMALQVTEKTMYNYFKQGNELTKIEVVNILVEHTDRPLSEFMDFKPSKLLLK